MLYEYDPVLEWTINVTMIYTGTTSELNKVSLSRYLQS